MLTKCRECSKGFFPTAALVVVCDACISTWPKCPVTSSRTCAGEGHMCFPDRNFAPYADVVSGHVLAAKDAEIARLKASKGSVLDAVERDALERMMEWAHEQGYDGSGGDSIQGWLEKQRVVSHVAATTDEIMSRRLLRRARPFIADLANRYIDARYLAQDIRKHLEPDAPKKPTVADRCLPKVFTDLPLR